MALGLGLASYYLISNYFVQSVQVVGSSMTPTLHNAEFYLLNRIEGRTVVASLSLCWSWKLVAALCHSWETMS